MKTRSGIVAGIALALGMASVALGFGHGGPDGASGPGGRLVERLVFPCRSGCFDTSRTCFQTAGSTATTCTTSRCESQIGAARTACAPGRTSACESAIGTLETCAQPCTDTAATSATSCRDTMLSCVTACGQS